jgi:hypothetical protein
MKLHIRLHGYPENHGLDVDALREIVQLDVEY